MIYHGQKVCFCRYRWYILATVFAFFIAIALTIFPRSRIASTKSTTTLPNLGHTDSTVSLPGTTTGTTADMAPNKVTDKVPGLQKEQLEKLRKHQLERELNMNQMPNAGEGMSYSDSDRYTQSEAHLSLPAIKKLVEEYYSDKRYDKIKAAVLANEKRYKNYYVFYHGMDSVWRLAQDIYLQLYAYFNASSFNPVTDFMFLRFDKENFKEIDPQHFLIQELKKNGLINDHDAMGTILFSANFALFGNVGTPSECSWEYFIKSRDHLNPNRAIYEKMMSGFGLTHAYIDKLMALTTLYKTPEETLLQIFIPKNMVDKIGYLAWIKGIPAYPEIMDWVMNAVAQKRYPKTKQAIIDLTKKLKEEQEQNFMFKNLLEQVKAGSFELNKFLRIYRNNPGSIKNINSFMARFLFTPSVLLNPSSGIKVFRYSTITKAQITAYYQSLNALIDTILE